MNRPTADLCLSAVVQRSLGYPLEAIGRILAGVAAAATALSESVMQQLGSRHSASHELWSLAVVLSEADATPKTAAGLLQQKVLPLATRLAVVLLDLWCSDQDDLREGKLSLAQAAAMRSCVYLRCANLGGKGGPATVEGAGNKQCR